MTEPFEILEHPADLGIRAYGPTLAEAFINAARGLLHVIVEGRPGTSDSRRVVSLRGSDPEHLLVKWLSEVLYLYDAERFVPAEFRFTEFSDTRLAAELAGAAFDERHHQAKLDVKAITYHQLRIENRSGASEVTVYVDI